LLLDDEMSHPSTKGVFYFSIGGGIVNGISEGVCAVA
jgi:hypothetical protein